MNIISTDSTVYIWVSTELPEYINPGARTNNVKGAVLGFQLIQRGMITTITKAMLDKIAAAIINTHQLILQATQRSLLSFYDRSFLKNFH